MVKFFPEARECGSGFINCYCSHTGCIKKPTDEVEKEGGRERQRERERENRHRDRDRVKDGVLPALCLVPGLQALELSLLSAPPAPF